MARFLAMLRPAMRRISSKLQDEDDGDDVMSLKESLKESLHMQHAIREERKLPASQLEASRLLGCRPKMNAHEGQGREGGAAFGRLIELATRGAGSPLRPSGPREVLSSPSSLPRRIFVPAERYKPPNSHERLLAQRAHDGSPLRPTAFVARVVPTQDSQRASGSAPAAADAAAHRADKFLPKDDTTPDLPRPRKRLRPPL